MTGQAQGCGAKPRECPFKVRGSAVACDLGPFCPTHPDECPFLATSVRASGAASPPLPVAGDGRMGLSGSVPAAGTGHSRGERSLGPCWVPLGSVARTVALALCLVTAGCAAGIEYRVGEGLLAPRAREAAALGEADRALLRELLNRKGLGEDAVTNPRRPVSCWKLNQRFGGKVGGQITTEEARCL